MYPDSFKEELGSGIVVMLFLQATRIAILEKRSTNTKMKSFPLLVDGRPDM
jgi:hypothetical protein